MRFVFGPIIVLVYLMPALIATYRNHPQARAILVVNIFLGWTFFGWVFSLVWAVWNFREKVTSSSRDSQS